MRLIDADKLLTYIGDFAINNSYEINAKILERMQEIVNHTPTVKPKKGKWILESIKEVPFNGDVVLEPIFRCSYCWKITESYIRHEKPSEATTDYPNFCQHCGADMRTSDNNKTSDKVRGTEE